MKKIQGFDCKVIFRFRYVFVAIPIVLSLVSLVFIGRLNITTRSKDFYPTRHPFVKVQRKLNRIFGGLNTVNVAISVRGGTILNTDVLSKIKGIYEDLTMLDDVNPRRVLCIFSRQIKKVRVYPGGFEIRRFLRDPPETRKDLEKLKVLIQRNPLVYGPLVSKDFKSAIIKVEFREDASSADIYREVNAVLEKYKGENIAFYVSGSPILEGYIQEHLGFIFYIFAVALLVILVLLFLAFGKKRGFSLPLSSGVMSVLMTLGVMGIFRFPLNPFTVLVPFLIFVVAVSHSIQFMERYFEVAFPGTPGDTIVEKVLSSLMSPVRASLFTDFLGFFSLYFIPIPSIRYMAITGGVGILTIFLTVVLFLPAIFSVIPPPFPLNHEREMGFVSKAVAFFQALYRRKVAIGTVVVLLSFVSFLGLSKIVVGEVEPGTSILYRNAPYNVSERFIDRHFSGSVPYYVLVEGEGEDSLVKASAVSLMDSLETHLERSVPEVGYGLSLADYIKFMNMVISGGNPRFFRVPKKDSAVGEYLFLLESNSFPGVFSSVIDPSHRYANIRLDLKDCRFSTLERVVSETRSWISRNGEAIKGAGVRFLYAGGVAGLKAATDDVIKSGLWKTFFIISFLILMRISFALGSFTGGLVLFVPLLLSMLVTFGSFGLLGIPLTLATLPVAAVGSGLGIDYSIYLASRIKEEVESGFGLDESIERALSTCGKAVFFTGSILAIGIFSWVFSNLRLQAKLGWALGLLIASNMLAALVVLPAFVVLVKPKFLKSGGES